LCASAGGIARLKFEVEDGRLADAPIAPIAPSQLHHRSAGNNDACRPAFLAAMLMSIRMSSHY
jgi:hypothetical protein